MPLNVCNYSCVNITTIKRCIINRKAFSKICMIQKNNNNITTESF